MHKFISFNHQIISAKEARLLAVSSAALYGASIFSTVAIYHAKPFLWEKHWRRLNENAAKIGIDLSRFTEEKVKNSLLKIIEKNNFRTGRARVTFFDQTLCGVWTFNPEKKTSLLVITGAPRRIKKNFSLTVSPFRLNSLSPLANVKSGNYLERLLALKDAREKGCDEAICFNEREKVVSALTANIFWVKNKQIFTPPLETGCLAGTTREFILENSSVREKQIGIKELFKADEIFLTSSGVGITTVRDLENHSYSSFEITEYMQGLFKNSIKKK
jgi:branched-subunit amino acid aminotransferase/4-amino-4-deoxychorismate lyase